MESYEKHLIYAYSRKRKGEKGNMRERKTFRWFLDVERFKSERGWNFSSEFRRRGIGSYPLILTRLPSILSLSVCRGRVSERLGRSTRRCARARARTRTPDHTAEHVGDLEPRILSLSLSVEKKGANDFSSSGFPNYSGIRVEVVRRSIYEVATTISATAHRRL